jgi:hypothetical protein
LGTLAEEGSAGDSKGGSGKGKKEGGGARRSEVEKHVREMLGKVVSCAPQGLDRASDARARSFIRERLPPVLPPWRGVRNPEKDGDDEALLEKTRETLAGKISAASRVRLHRHNSARVFVEDRVCVVYHASNNSRDYHGKEEEALEFDLEYLAALKQLIWYA